LKKMGSQRETPLTLRDTGARELAELTAGSASIISVVVQLNGAENPAVITLMAEPSRHRSAGELDGELDA
jgi:hypothetical protein